jgi:hypothetical protein
MNEDPYATWGRHQWSQSTPRELQLESGQSVLQRQCIRCRRDFVIDQSSGARHAVFVSIISFYQLPEEVTMRWLAEPCPGKPLPSDGKDRTKLGVELRISGGRNREQRGSRAVAAAPRSFRTKQR